MGWKPAIGGTTIVCLAERGPRGDHLTPVWRGFSPLFDQEVLDAHLLDLSQPGFQPVNMILFVRENAFQQQPVPCRQPQLPADALL